MAVNYREYIQSPQWRAVRQRYFNSGLPQICWACDAPRVSGFHIHHRTYKNLGKERLMDLVLLCPACHDAVHAHHRSLGPRGELKGLWYSTRGYIRASRKRRGLTSDVAKSPAHRRKQATNV